MYQTTMDRSQQDMKLVGFFGIFKQSFKTIFTSSKIFIKITLTLILPLTIIFLAHMMISDRFFSRIEYNYEQYSRYKNKIINYWLYYILFKIVYLTLLAVFSVLSTAAIVFTISSVYTDRDVVFHKVMTLVVPNVWKKLFITFVTIYFTLFIYNLIQSVILVILEVVFGKTSVSGAVVGFIIVILFIILLLYLTVVLQLASVVTVLENIHGFKALKKGKLLASGNKAIGMGIAFMLYGILYGLLSVYKFFVEWDDSGLAMIWRVMIGILCGILVMLVFLLFIVTQTVLYMVCKSYHHEAIDKLSLSTFLSAYMVETVVYPQPGEEIQLGRPQPQPQPQPLAQQV